MNFIFSLFIASITACGIYQFLYFTSSKNEKILKEKGIEGITSKYMITVCRKKGMSDEQIVDVLLKNYQNNKKWAPLGAVIGFILALILFSFFKLF